MTNGNTSGGQIVNCVLRIEYSELMEMNEGQSFIFLADPAETTAEEVTWLREHLLSEEEQDSTARFVSAQDRHDRVVSRALVRLALSSFCSVAPQDWHFSRDKNQKPFVISSEAPDFQFSLSHTRGMIALLVTLARHAGVDVENITAVRDLKAVAARVLSESELKSMRELSGDDWTLRFFELWTLKEAYSKARGLGMSLPFTSVTFGGFSNGHLRATFEPDVDDQPDEWQFWNNRPSRQHVLSAAIRREAGRQCEIILRRVRVGAAPKLEIRE
jgi:4'-phosphopantetheinyl transferase